MNTTLRHGLLVVVFLLALFSLKACLSDNGNRQAATASTADDSTGVEPVPVFAGFPAVAPEQVADVNDQYMSNLEAPVPPQCYTRTEQQHNPCYTCHQIYPRGDAAPYRMNKLDDGNLQGAYLFSDIGVHNHWANLFEDRSDWVAAIDDKSILRYINDDNYSALAGRLEARNWQGFVPDLANYHQAAAAFDEQGLAKDGSHWVAFNYKPLPSTFWPTNGSTDDVLIRLPAPFRQLAGQPSTAVYFLNLSLLEMAIKDLPVMDIVAVDENLLARDINGDGQIAGKVDTLVMQDHYFADADSIAVLPQQYPQDTEFMHSVRYVGVTNNGDIVVPPRMKELRYMKKLRTFTDHELENRYWRERKEKFEGKLPNFVFLNDKGFDNGYGWLVQGFIEDGDGELRPQSFEEGMFCMGCHAAIGTTIDHTFAFGRKLTGRQGWGYINLHGMADAPNNGSAEPEILDYLRRVGGGNEFRENREMQARWFDEHGQLREQAVREADVYQLITPSAERALALNKAYTHIVRHQDFIHGRDATIQPAVNVLRDVDENQPPLTGEHQLFGWDMRLDWQ